MNRLHERGYITEPRGKAKSVVFTEEELDRARSFLETLLASESKNSFAWRNPTEHVSSW